MIHVDECFKRASFGSRKVVDAHRLFGSSSIRAGRNLGTVRHKAMRSIQEASSLNGPLKSEEMPVMYTHVLCPYAQRVWMTLLEKVSTFSTPCFILVSYKRNGHKRSIYFQGSLLYCNAEFVLFRLLLD